VLLLTNRPTDSGQDVTDRELQQSLDFILPRLPAATRVFGTQRRGMDPKPICQAVPQDPNRLARVRSLRIPTLSSAIVCGHRDRSDRLGGPAVVLFAITDATAKYAADLPD